MSGGFYQDGTYSPATRRRYQVAILLIAGLCSAAIAYRLTSGHITVEQLIGQLTIVAFFAGCLWWAFASKTSGPVKLEARSAAYVRQLMRTRQKK